MTYTVRSVPLNLLDRMWPFAEPFIKRALDHTSGEFSPVNIKKYCEDETILLLLVFDGSRVVAAATVEIVQYPNVKRLRVGQIGGTGFDNWISELDAAWQNIAREHNCTSMEMFVRRGFVPKLADWGWKQKHVMVVKDI